MALLNFDSTQIQIQSREPIPNGTYEAVAIESEIRATKAGTGRVLNITFEIVSGEHKGRRVWSRINVSNPNQTAERIGKEELATLCRAVNVPQLTDTVQLHDKPLMITVARDRNDDTHNVVTKYAARQERSPWAS